MLDITPRLSKAMQVIDAYGGGAFTIAGTVQQGSILLFPEKFQSWGVNRFSDVTETAISPLLQREDMEIILLGCGVDHLPTPPNLRQACQQRGIGLEVMNTGAACRTYNVLLAEGRQVAAGLIAI